jgi:hypothetical protein
MAWNCLLAMGVVATATGFRQAPHCPHAESRDTWALRPSGIDLAVLLAAGIVLTALPRTRRHERLRRLLVAVLPVIAALLTLVFHLWPQGPDPGCYLPD